MWHEGCLPSEMFPFDSKERRELGMFPIICYLQLGYNPKTRLRAFVEKVEIINGNNTDLHKTRTTDNRTFLILGE